MRWDPMRCVEKNRGARGNTVTYTNTTTGSRPMYASGVENGKDQGEMEL